MVPVTDELAELQAWYHSQCNDEWEHSYGVKIDTLDNPGWTVEIDLTDTTLAGRPFRAIEDLEPELDWMKCEVQGTKWMGAGGPNMLKPILRVFLKWAKGGNGASAV